MDCIGTEEPNLTLGGCFSTSHKWTILEIIYFRQSKTIL